MGNIDIFKQFDMVVSVTQKTLNDQLTHLLKLGVIESQLIILRRVDRETFVYEICKSENDIPKDPQGNPTCSYINAIIKPQVDIRESGSNIVLVIEFISGTACFGSSYGPFESYDMTGWSYGISVTMDMKKVEDSKIKVPDLVKSQLENFNSNMFTARSLFMDFESTNLIDYIQTKIQCWDCG